MQPRLTLNSSSSCLNILSAGISRHIPSQQAWGWFYFSYYPHVAQGSSTAKSVHVWEQMGWWVSLCVLFLDSSLACQNSNEISEGQDVLEHGSSEHWGPRDCRILHHGLKDARAKYGQAEAVSLWRLCTEFCSPRSPWHLALWESICLTNKYKHSETFL